MSALSARTWLPALLSLFSSCAWMRPDPPDYPRIERSDGLVIRDLVVPEAGAEVDSGDAVAIHYELWLSDHTLVESSLDSGQPLRFEIGKGQVPPGLEQGVLGMRLYGSRRIVVPPELAYGSEGRPPLIPADSTLTFDVELMEHEPR
jgi:FKBP-type peptidyl-prolyl cis-trans isomerase